MLSALFLLLLREAVQRSLIYQIICIEVIRENFIYFEVYWNEERRVFFVHFSNSLFVYLVIYFQGESTLRVGEAQYVFLITLLLICFFSWNQFCNLLEFIFPKTSFKHLICSSLCFFYAGYHVLKGITEANYNQDTWSNLAGDFSSNVQDNRGRVVNISPSCKNSLILWVVKCQNM